MRFTGKTALITGASSGIGRATALALAQQGCSHLVLVDQQPAEGEDLPGAWWIAQDVADPDAWASTEARIRERLAGVDLVVANAGIADAAPIVEMSFAAWRRVVAVNLDGAFLTLQAGLRLIRDGGAVVVVASASAQKAEPGVAAYGASKAGALHLARVAAKEAAPRRVRVNAILPGGVQTPIWRGMDFFQELVQKQGGEAGAFAAMGKMATPLGRYALPEETAAQICFLLSEEAAIMTGAALVADGGYSL